MAEGCAIDWNAFLGTSRAHLTLACLRPTFKHYLAVYLNAEVVVVRDGYFPNWRGLAQLIGFDGIEINDIGRGNPCEEVIERWINNVNLKPTIGNLVKYLIMLDRMDILTDYGDTLMEDIEFHENRRAHFEEENPLQDNTVSSPEMAAIGSHILTIDDTLTSIAIYDAFVSYEFSDLAFVKDMIHRLENKGFKLFIPGRNNLIGTNSFELMSRIISERCRHMIVVLSKNFIKSEICNFQSAYAFSLNPGARDKKMVPIKIEECSIPEPLRIMALCDFTHQDILDWSWDRLEASIRRPMPNPEFIGPRAWYENSQSSPSSSSSSFSRSTTSVHSQPTRPCVPRHSLPVSGDRNEDGESGYISGLGSERQATGYSSRHDPTVDGKPSGSQDSTSNVKVTVSKAFKRLTNFGSSPKSKKKGKMETTKF